MSRVALTLALATTGTALVVAGHILEYYHNKELKRHARRLRRANEFDDTKLIDAELDRFENDPWVRYAGGMFMHCYLAGTVFLFGALIVWME